jgi:hypothetical protein
MDPEDQHRLETDNLMLIIGLIVAIVIILGLILAWPVKAQDATPPHAIIHIEEVTNQGVVAQPILTPHFDMETVSDFPPDKGDVLSCVITDSVKTYTDHNEKYLLFGCTRAPVPGKSTQPAFFTLKLTGLAFETER